jgi:hypothetical protein
MGSFSLNRIHGVHVEKYGGPLLYQQSSQLYRLTSSGGIPIVTRALRRSQVGTEGSILCGFLQQRFVFLCFAVFYWRFSTFLSDLTFPVSAIIFDWWALGLSLFRLITAY